MMKKEMLDLYSDYLLSSFGATTATGMAAMLEGAVSHDQITRQLGGRLATSADWWQQVKPEVRKMQSAEGVLIIDDSIAEKAYTDENELVCWHWDHAQGRSVKGINFVTALYCSQEQVLPVGYHLIAKTETYTDKKTGAVKQRSPVTKNEVYRQLVTQAVKNEIPFRYVVNDVWFASAENMRSIQCDLQKEFVMPLKSNRKLALSLEAQQTGQYVHLDTLLFETDTPQQVYLEAVPFPLLLVKQVFTNEDGSTGVLYLVSSDTRLTADRIFTVYRTRWQVECFHKSLKQNASLEKSPAQTFVTQANHFFAALYAFVKLERLRTATHLHHFALKSKLYLHALRAAFAHLRSLPSAPFA